MTLKAVKPTSSALELYEDDAVVVLTLNFGSAADAEEAFNGLADLVNGPGMMVGPVQMEAQPTAAEGEPS